MILGVVICAAAQLVRRICQIVLSVDDALSRLFEHFVTEIEICFPNAPDLRTNRKLVLGLRMLDVADIRNC